MAVRITLSGLTATVVGSGDSTVSSATPITPDAVAVTIVSPALTPVARPVSSTMATSVSLDVHAKVASATGWSFASAATDANRAVSPWTTVSAAGDTVTVLITWATVTAAVPEAEPAVPVIVEVPLATAVTRPAALTVATAALLLAQVTVVPAIT